MSIARAIADDINVGNVGLPLKDSNNADVLAEDINGVVTLTADEANVGSNALVVDSSGRVGIGTSSPIRTLTVSQAGTAEFVLQDTTRTVDGRNFRIFYDNGGLAFGTLNDAGTAGTERMRIDSSGNVGFGTINPKSRIHINASHITFQQNYYGVLGNAYYSGGWKYVENGSAWAIGNNYGGPPNGFTIGHAPVNSSGNDAALTWTYAMGIDVNGYVLLGYTASNGSYRLQVNSQIFAANGTIATSDGRYKENILPLDNGLAIVKALNPVQFDWKEHPVHKFDREQPNVGFIAQEVQEVLADKAYKNSIIKSNSTVITPEELDEDGNVITAEVTEEFLGIAEGNLIAILTKAIQEQQILIESQQSQIDTLTTKTQEQDFTIASLISRIEALETQPT